MKHIWLLSFVSTLMLPLCASAAFACSDLPNICEQRETEMIAQNNEMAAEAEEYAAWAREEYQNGDGGEEVAPPRAMDPMQSRLNSALSTMINGLKLRKQKANIAQDPKFKTFVNGSWSYFQDYKGAKPGEYCAAFFTRDTGFVMLTGPGRGYQGALLTFWGVDVPRPESARKIKVTLIQTGDKPQTVQAFNYYNPAQGMGAIAMAVPTIQAALDGLLDKATFELVTGGKSVAKVSWHSGFKMKSKMASCVAKYQG